MAKKQLEEGQIVLCTVNKIAGTIVFVKIEEYDLEGTITFSEISPGRIRNIRDYVFPGKKIVCKVLRIKPQGIDLSLRRVKLKEKTELNEAYKKEKSFKALLKTIIKDKAKAEKIIDTIKEKEDSLTDFLEEIKENPKLLEKYIEKTSAEKIIKILQEKKAKQTVLKRKFSLTSKDPRGILLIKELINKAIKEAGCQNCEVSYIAAGKYSFKTKTKDLRQADSQIDKAMEILEDSAKKQNCRFSQLK